MGGFREPSKTAKGVMKAPQEVTCELNGEGVRFRFSY